ncbi:class I adenylate-forming enzyme family protein [Pelosinus sp. UFO1]|uniref:class I adenylate-forming enzyme family protein n=1 Tax=Pelosinus sp. UFO1 TaxID=484770 RepID=UPI0004D0DF8E|nr:AMP-binding protein [Pelosinus sp. UFO1]AIF53982.1 Long-chain-fatty-acid--CoA ligase [Pelosinus sp. UFO1]
MLVHDIIQKGDKDQIAFLEKTPITYGQAEDAVAKYRDFFYQQGIRSGENVGLFSKNSVDFIYCYLAITSLGAVIVPLNFQLVPREVAYVIYNANIKKLITMTTLDLDTELATYDYPEKIIQLLIPEISKAINNLNIPPAPVPQSIHEDEICTIIYTSGTTGQPKGAMLTHKNLVSNAQAFSQVFTYQPSDRILCVLPMYHCFAWTAAVLTPLLNGCSIAVLENFLIRDTISMIRDNALTIIFGIPNMFRLFSQWATKDDFSHVRLYVSGGSSLPQEISEQFTKKFDKQIAEGYGLSEASPIVSLNPIDNIKFCSIGKPLPGIKVKISSEENEDEDLPPGEIGELLVNGPNVMKGYYKLPADSAKALQKGWLHTGDLAYMDQDGYLFIVDRLKDMIIINGENIYPREIEELLYAYPTISEVAVIGVHNKLHGTAVHAYIVPKEESIIDKKLLKAYLQGKLAPFKIPKEFIIVDSLPKNTTGKILKTVLRQQYETRINK